MKFVNENKWFVVFYLVWLFLQLTLYFVSDGKPAWNFQIGFWPFNRDMAIDAYDFLELFVYLSLPILVFVIIKLVGKDIKKAIDENN